MEQKEYLIIYHGEDNDGHAIVSHQAVDARQDVVQELLNRVQGFSSLLMIALGASGTGSYPPLANGLQRKNRQIVSALPFNAPKRSIASSPYCEHVGVYMQWALV